MKTQTTTNSLPFPLCLRVGEPGTAPPACVCLDGRRAGRAHVPSNLRGWFRASTVRGHPSLAGGAGAGRRSIPSGRVWSPLQATLWTATEAHSPVPPRARLAWVQPVTHQHWSGLQPSPTNTKILGKKELAMEKPLRDQAMKYQVLLWTATSGSSPGL